jgi:hypothetical protein
MRNRVKIEYTRGHETEHPFQIPGDSNSILCEGIIVKDFLENKKAKVDYEQKEIVMGDVKVKCDDNHTNNQINEVYFMLNPRCETVVQLPTLSD